MNPFPGLRPFTQEEDYLFFGREEQTLELLQRLGSNRFVAVVGTSGSGKSSLVRCGLLSELLGGRMLGAGSSWEIAVTHPGGNPLALLTDSLLEADLYDREEEHARENLLATLSRSHFGLVEAVKQADLGEGTNFLLVVDQFEEIFRFQDAGQRQQEVANEFVSLLLEAVAQKEVPIYVVLTMRSDFIGECGQFEGLAEMVNKGEFLIPRLTREQYKRVIEGPIKVAGGQIAPRLLQRLLNDLGQQADQLPCLQHALMRTWDVWAQKKGSGLIDAQHSVGRSGQLDLTPFSSLDLDDYQRVGRMAEALSLHADEIYDSLANDRQRELCKGIFQALTVEESNNRGIRRPQRLGRLCQILEVPAEELVPIIDAYRHSGVTFLMPSPDVELTESTIIDISHESLMRVWTRLRQWVEEESQASGIYHRLSESADLHAEGKAGLYRDPELGIALAWQEAEHPNAAWAERYRPGFATAMSFLEASQQASIAEEQASEAARQRELQQAQQLAEAQQLRIEQQQRSARNSRKMIGGLALVATLAGLACLFALIAHNKANRLARIASLEAENALKKEAKAEQAQRTTEAALAEVAAEKNRAESSLERAKLAEMRSSELRERETVLKQIAEQKELEARRQYYASDSSNASYAARSGDQFPRIAGYVARWSGEKNAELRDWEYYHLLTQIRLPTIEWDFRKITPGSFDHNTGVAWSPAGRRIATVRGAGNLIQVFDAELGERIWKSVEFQEGRGQAIDRGQAIEWSPCGNLIAAGSTSGIVRVLAADSGEILAEFRAHEQCKRLKWYDDGARLLTCGGQEAKIWSTRNWTLLHTLRGQTADIVNIAHNGAGRVGACGADGLVTVWDATTGELLQNWSHGGDVVAWDWASATNRMAFASRSPVAITIRDVDSWSLERTLADERLGSADAAVGETMGSLSEIAWSPDGKLLATIGGGYGGGTRSLWDVPSGSLLDIAAQPGMIAIDWSDDGRMLATAGWQDRVQIWPLEITSMPKLLKGAANFCWGPGGRYLATSQKSEITIWDAYQWRPLQTLDGGTGEITSMCLSSDERLIAVADEQRNLRVWNLESEEVVRHFSELKAKFATVAFSPDQRWLSGVDGSSLLHVWNTESWEETTARVRGDFQKWSPDSRFILAGNGNFNFSGGEPSYALWETASKQLRNLDRYFFDPTRAAWNPDGTGAAIVAHTDNIAVLKLDAAGRPDVSGSYREMGRVHSSFIKQMDWSPIGNRMVTVGGEKLARIWDMQALQQVHEIENALDAGWDAYGLRLAVRTPVGVEIHDATIGGARGHWQQLLPMLAREQELGRISDGDLRTMCEIRCAHGEWGSAIQTIAELMERNPADVRNQHLAGETFLRYAGIPLRAEGALGVRMSTQALQLPESDNAPRLGYKLTEVIPDGPADRSGLQPDDVVTRIQEYREGNLSEAIKVTSPGSTLGIELYRNGQRLRMPLRIGYLNTTGETARLLPVDVETIDRTIDGRQDARDFIRRARDMYLSLCQAEPGHPVHLKRLILTLSFLPSDEVTQWQQSLHRDAKFHAAALALHRYQGEQAIWLERFDEAASCFEAALRLGGDRDENTVTVELAAPHRVVLERLAQNLPEIDAIREAMRTWHHRPGVLAVWNFDTVTRRWGAAHHCDLSVKDGVLNVLTTGTDPNFSWPASGPAGGKTLVLRYRTDEAFTMQILWADSSGGLAEARHLDYPIPASSGEWAEIALPFWCTGMLNTLRLDPNTASEHPLEIDSIVLQNLESPEAWSSDDWMRITQQQPGMTLTAFDFFKQAERWNEAAPFGLQLAEQKRDNVSEDSLVWLRIAPVLASADDPRIYSDFCSRMVQHFAASELPEVHDRVIKAALLRPNSIDLAKLPGDQLAKSLDDGTAPEWLSPWAWASRALLAYRRGDAESAVRCVAKSEEYKPIDVTHAMNLAVLTMAQHQLGKPDEAKTALKEASKLITRLKEDPGRKGDLDLLIAKILFNEAKELIDGKE